MYNEISQVKRVKGTQDILLDEYEIRRGVFAKVLDVFERFGYRGVQAPTIEELDLHLRKSGESIRRKMYTFKDQGMDSICLRPELTASIVRMYNKELINEHLPLKLYYIGSAFRYDQPQLGRYREFTQAGVELIGGAATEYDAEVIALACHVMEELGIKNYELVIGNIGIILDLLSQKRIDDRVKNYLVESLESLSKANGKMEGMKEIENGLQKIGVSIEDLSEDKMELLEAVKQLPYSHAEKVIAWVIQTIYGNTGGGRDSYEISRNLLSKITRDEQRIQIRESLDFISEITKIEGAPPKVFDRVHELIKSYNLDPRPIDELRIIADYLDYYNIDWSKVKIDFGFGRGIAYYTGMIFEIYCYTESLGESQKQVCGGGRYDSLIRDLGGPRQISALGFSFGLERIVLAMPSSDQKRPFLDVFVAPIGKENEFRYALNIINLIRKEGLRADIGPMGAAPRELAGMGKRLGTNYTLFIGEDEISKKTVSLRYMKSGVQKQYKLEEAIKLIKEGVIESS